MADEQEIVGVEKEPSSFRLISTLGLAGLLSGIVLVTTYLLTAPLIAENKAKALQEAIFEVLPNTVEYETYALVDGRLNLLENSDSEELVYMGLNEDRQMTGFAIPGSQAGYQDIISAICGYDPIEKKIIGFKVLESKETPGLGDKIFKDEEFQENFKSLAVEPSIEVVKKSEKTAEYQIAAITGATISSNAVGRLLDNSIQKWKEPIQVFVEQNETSHE